MGGGWGLHNFASSFTLPTLRRDEGKSLHAWAYAAFFDNFGMGRETTCFPLLTPPFATLTFFVDLRRMGRLALALSFFADIIIVGS